jgi:hypothetical protein
VTGAVALSGCESYGPYGYSGVSIGVGTGGFYGGYGGGYGGGYYDGGYYPSYGYARPWGGWYGDYYYPGTGVIVYDRDRRGHRWNDDQRRYWEQRRAQYRAERRHRR